MDAMDATDATDPTDGVHPPDRLLADLSARLEALADQPVADHPAVLEAVHRAVVDELEGLGAGGRATSAAAPGAAER